MIVALVILEILDTLDTLESLETLEHIEPLKINVMCFEDGLETEDFAFEEGKALHLGFAIAGIFEIER